MSDKNTEKLPCDDCYTTYKDEKSVCRCDIDGHRTEGYYAEDICLEKGYYYAPQSQKAEIDNTPSFDIFR